MKLIALGDNVIDYYHNTQECFPGGNAVNVAVHAARLGAQAEYLGSLGDDDMAHIVEKALRENGVDISHCPVLQGRTTKVCSYDATGSAALSRSSPGKAGPARCRSVRRSWTS